MTSVLVCIPTVPTRQAYLVNAGIGYKTRAPDDVEINFSIVTDAQSAGEGWNRCAEQGLEWFPQTTHLHFGNDDVVPATGWLPPLLEAMDRDCVPCPRIEPAGGHIPGNIFQTHPPMAPAYFPVPRDPAAYFYADIPERQPTADWQEINHGNLPTCSRHVWERVKPFPPIHYGTDAYFYRHARRLGHRVVARLDSVFFNYNAPQGRHKIVDGVEWNEQMWLDYDGVFSLPKYLHGVLEPTEPDPLRGTPEGAEMIREWRRQHLGATGG